MSCAHARCAVADNESHLSFEGGFLSAKPLMHSNFDARYQRASDADFKNYKDETELVIGKMVK